MDDLVNSIVDDSIADDSLSSDESEPFKGAPADRIGAQITATDIDAIRQKIAQCWIVPIGGREARDLVVDVRMNIAQDGTVQRAEVVNRDRISDPTFKAAAESAERAVLDPACNPLPLPADAYDKWKVLTLRFNPKDMY